MYCQEVKRVETLAAEEERLQLQIQDLQASQSRDLEGSRQKKSFLFNNLNFASDPFTQGSAYFWTLDMDPNKKN